MRTSDILQACIAARRALNRAKSESAAVTHAVCLLALQERLAIRFIVNRAVRHVE